MRAHPPLARLPRVQAADGFTIVEVLIAALVLAVGVLGLIGSFDSARKLTLVAERQTTMAHRAQLELERLQTYPYGQLAMISAPSHSATTSNPDYYVNLAGVPKCTSVGAGCYAWNGESTGEEEALVPAAKATECATTAETECGRVAASPSGRKCAEKTGACEWSDGPISGNVYDFVTWHVDKCAKCTGEKNYKRLSVVVTATVPKGNHEPTPLRVSTLVAEPH